jgi:hypothetical protein
MTDEAASRLGSGRIVIRGQHAKAPIVSIAQSTGLVTQFDLASDFLTYEADPKGVVGATQITGTLRAEQSAQRTVRTASRQEKRFHASLQSFVDTIYPTGIIIHHTALVASEKLPKGEKEVDAYHQQRGFEIYCSGQSYHVAYHYLILPDGTVQRGRPERCEGAHAKGYNSYIGISVIGDFSSADNANGEKGPERPNERQLGAVVELCRILRNKYSIPLQHIVRHSDIASTDCPGDRFPFNELLRRLQLQSDISKVSKE